jgi:hypothetical protein
MVAVALWMSAITAGAQHRTGFVRSFDRGHAPVLQISASMRAAVPDAIDWSLRGAVTAVRDQGHCSSCWAYSATEAIESATYIQTGTLPKLSEQNLIDCDTADQGCRGGDPPIAFKYAQSHGLATMASYPDTSANSSTPGSCLQKKEAVKVASWAYAVPPCSGGSCTSQDEEGLKAVLAAHGPLSVCVNAEESDPQPDTADWHAYTGGILQGSCRGTYRELDHCVQVCRGVGCAGRSA